MDQAKTPDSEELLNPAEASAILGITREAIIKWEQAGMLHSARTAGKHRRYKASEIRALKAHLLMKEDTFSPAEAAITAGVSVRTIWRWVRDGKLHPIPYRKRTRYSKAEVLAARSSRRLHPDIKSEDIARMRDKEKLTWREITQRTGMSRSSLGDRYARLKKLADKGNPADGHTN